MKRKEIVNEWRSKRERKQDNCFLPSLSFFVFSCFVCLIFQKGKNHGGSVSLVKRKFVKGLLHGSKLFPMFTMEKTGTGCLTMELREYQNGHLPAQPHPVLN